MLVNNIIIILILNGTVLIVPGLNFYLVSRIAMKQGISFGLMTVLGITFGIMVHVLIAMIGLFEIHRINEALFIIIKWAGVTYILFLALKIALKGIRNKQIQNISNMGSLSRCFINGFIIDLLNPYITFFYIYLFSQILNENITSLHLIIFAIIIFAIVFIWFSMVTLIFSIKNIKKYYEKNIRSIELLSCFIFIFFAIKLAIL